ncbi:MAG: type II toxin-antitoxin system RelB/DinJ family antitoxin [Ruminococcus sp.]|nr:type II toxin-antitoxin system RelB/DinJ family antitoxin [Ruminococcus sp.]
MAKVSTNVSIDADIKKQAQELFAELGMDLSTAINIFIRQALRQHSIPFEITADDPNKETREAIAEVRRMKKDPTIGKAYDDVDDMFEELLS